MNQINKNPQINYYKKLIKIYGNDKRISGWGSEKSQEKRFRILSRYIKKDILTILDVGCGRGDLVYFLKKKKIKINYTGLDEDKNLLYFAKKNHRNCKFIYKEISTDKIKRYDLIYASGIFNVKMPNHKLWMSKILKKLYNQANRYLIFNNLSLNAKFYDQDLFYCNKKIIINLLSDLKTNFFFEEKYFSHDFTTIISKNKWIK